MSRFTVFLRRAGLGCAGLTVVLGIAGVVLYQQRYILPPLKPRSLPEPTPNGYQTMMEAAKLEVKELNGIQTSPQTRDTIQPLEGRKKLVAANAASIAKLREALTQEWLSPAWLSPAQTFPEYAQFREEARMLSLAAQTHAEAGSLSEAAQCATDAIELGVKMPRGGVLITGLVGLACEAIGEAALWRIADKLDAKTARTTITRIVALEPKRTSFAAILEEEGRFSDLSTRQIFAKGPLGAWKDLSSQLDPFQEVEDVGGTTTPSKRLQQTWFTVQVIYYGPRTPIEGMRRWMTALGALSEKPWGQQKPLPPMPQDPLSQMLAPVFSEAGYKWFQTRTNRALCTTYLALRAYRLEKGQDAPSLDALVQAGYLKTLPTDPFSPTRAPLRYQSGKLWSVGPDAKDDGGKPIDMEGKKGFVDQNKPGDIVARVNTW